MPNYEYMGREESSNSSNLSRSYDENILTFEIEDRFHVESPDIEPIGVRSRIIPILIHLLDLLDEQKARATFFILGWVARKFPEIAALIDSRGNEVASHGFTHSDVRRMSPEKFKEELERSRDLLEGILQKPILGYKASSPYLDRSHIKHYSVIAESGYRYDCSLSRVSGRMDSAKPFSMAVGERKQIIAIPQSAWRKAGLAVRFGEQMRILPGWFSIYAVKSLNRRGCPAMINMKLWELDIHHPRAAASEYLNYSSYGNINLAEQKLKKLLDHFRFTSCAEALKLHSNSL